MALLSVTEGEDKPLKYPTLFNSADAAVITKMDIAEAGGFDRDAAMKSINAIRPGIRIFETSAKTGAGMDEWLEWLEVQRAGRVSELASQRNERRYNTGHGDEESKSSGDGAAAVEAYLARVPEPHRTTLEKVRANNSRGGAGRSRRVHQLRYAGLPLQGRAGGLRGV